jgi:hypothetical protein
MRVFAALLLPSVLVLTACPGPDDPQDVEVPAAAEQVRLEQLEGSGITGEVAVTPRDNDVHMVVSVSGAPADESLDVRLHSGSCQSPGPEIHNIGTIRTTDMGTGAIETTVGENPALILDGNHIAVIWAPIRHDGDHVGTGATGTGTGTATTPAARDTPAATGTTPRQQDGGLLRDDRRAVACTTLPASR